MLTLVDKSAPLVKLAYQAAKDVGCEIQPVEGRDTFRLVERKTRYLQSDEQGVTMEHIVGLCECIATRKSSEWLRKSMAITESAKKFGIKMPLYVPDIAVFGEDKTY